MKELPNGEEVRITNDPHDQYNPHIYKNKIIWLDMRHGGEDIYCYVVQE